MGHRILVIDQGTTGTTCLVVRLEPEAGLQEIIGQGYAQLPTYFPKPGWVEQDLDEIWDSVCQAMAEAMDQAQLPSDVLVAIGIANQRETTAVWDRQGRPAYRAIGWQDRRTADRCQKLKKLGQAPMLQKRTGLVLDPYFSATKLGWLLDNVPGLRQRAHQGELHFGTLDTWLLWKLTAGAVYATDASNASRTLLYDIERGGWDGALCDLMGSIPMDVLPEVRSCSEIYGTTRNVGVLKDGIPISGMAGDQQAALFGQACVQPGMAKCTYGTGAFVLVNTGPQRVQSSHGLITTVAWRLGSQTTYALEGSVFVAGALVQWLRDGLGILRRSSDVEALAAQVQDTDGVVLVPALTGLGAPHWRPEACGLLCELTRGTRQAHVARAALEGIAFQIYDLLEAMQQDQGDVLRLSELRADGGACRSNLLMQFQADLLGIPIHRPRQIETTALGAAYLAALGRGLLDSADDVTHLWQHERTFRPHMPPAEVEASLKRWKRALQASVGLTENF